MTRGLDTLLAKLEARRRMHDDDLTRLSDAELEARIAAGEAALIAHYGGTIEAAIAALEQENDPAAVACVKALRQRQADQIEAA